MALSAIILTQYSVFISHSPYYNPTSTNYIIIDCIAHSDTSKQEKHRSILKIMFWGSQYNSYFC